LEFCSKWKSDLKNEVRLLRTEAETVADFYFIGKQTNEGKRVVVPECLEFFTAIVADSAKRQLSDFGYLARIEEWLGSPDAAISIAKKAHALYGDKWQVFFNCAWLQGRAENWKPAYLNSRRACELAPWHPPVWRQRTWIEQNLGMSAAVAYSRTRGDELSKKIEGMRGAARGSLRLKRVIE
jgi:hypothetical protein